MGILARWEHSIERGAGQGQNTIHVTYRTIDPCDMFFGLVTVHPGNFRTFPSPQGEMCTLGCPLQSHLPAPLARQPAGYFLSVWICTFCTVRTRGIIPYVAFSLWLLSRSTMSSRIIDGRVMAGVRTLLCGWTIVHRRALPSAGCVPVGTPSWGPAAPPHFPPHCCSLNDGQLSAAAGVAWL